MKVLELDIAEGDPADSIYIHGIEKISMKDGFLCVLSSGIFCPLTNCSQKVSFWSLKDWSKQTVIRGVCPEDQEFMFDFNVSLDVVATVNSETGENASKSCYKVHRLSDGQYLLKVSMNGDRPSFLNLCIASNPSGEKTSYFIISLEDSDELYKNILHLIKVSSDNKILASQEMSCPEYDLQVCVCDRTVSTVGHVGKTYNDHNRDVIPGVSDPTQCSLIATKFLLQYDTTPDNLHNCLISHHKFGFNDPDLDVHHYNGDMWLLGCGTKYTCIGTCVPSDFSHQTHYLQIR